MTVCVSTPSKEFTEHREACIDATLPYLLIVGLV